MEKKTFLKSYKRFIECNRKKKCRFSVGRDNLEAYYGLESWNKLSGEDKQSHSLKKCAGCCSDATTVTVTGSPSTNLLPLRYWTSTCTTLSPLSSSNAPQSLLPTTPNNVSSQSSSSTPSITYVSPSSISMTNLTISIPAITPVFENKILKFKILPLFLPSRHLVLKKVLSFAGVDTPYMVYEYF